jgi:hypothetical protein
MSVPFYADWKFWSFVASAIAIVLSQIPPLRVLLRRSKLSIDVHDRIWVTHDIGYPVVDLFVALSNDGGKPVTVKGFELRIEREGGTPVVLHARSYFETTSSQSPLLMVPQTLLPEARWGHPVKFLMDVPRLEEREVATHRLALQSDIAGKVARSKVEGRGGQLQRAEPERVVPLRRLFEQHFSWLAGDYRIDLVVKSDDGDRRAAYKFVLFESESDGLRALADDYETGEAVFFVSNRPAVFPRLTPAAD